MNLDSKESVMKDLGKNGYRKLQQCGAVLLLTGCLAFNVSADVPMDSDDDYKRGVQASVAMGKENQKMPVNGNLGMTKIVYEIPEKEDRRPLTPLQSLRRMVRGG
jgi:hypothetical protein